VIRTTGSWNKWYVTPGRVSQIEHGEVSTIEAIARYVRALGGRLDLVANFTGHTLTVTTTEATCTNQYRSQVRTSSDFARPSKTSPDAKPALICGHRTQRDTVRRNRHAWQMHGMQTIRDPNP
jgi:hypothetical protein